MVKWGGAAATIVFVAVWIASGPQPKAWAIDGGLIVGVCGDQVFCVDVNKTQPAGFGVFPVPAPDELHLAWGSITRSSFTLTLWYPLLVLVLATGTAWRIDARARRLTKEGHCSSCGYDLAGLAPESPCPECGRVAKPSQA